MKESTIENLGGFWMFWHLQLIMSVLAQTLKYIKTILFTVMARISYVLMNDTVNHKKPNIDEDAIEKIFNYMI